LSGELRSTAGNQRGEFSENRVAQRVYGRSQLVFSTKRRLSMVCFLTQAIKVDAIFVAIG
jgi:hypothetical protein